MVLGILHFGKHPYTSSINLQANDLAMLFKMFGCRGFANVYMCSKHTKPYYQTSLTAKDGDYQDRFGPAVGCQRDRTSGGEDIPGDCFGDGPGSGSANQCVGRYQQGLQGINPTGQLTLT